MHCESNVSFMSPLPALVLLLSLSAGVEALFVLRQM